MRKCLTENNNKKKVLETKVNDGRHLWQAQTGFVELYRCFFYGLWSSKTEEISTLT